MPKILVHPDQKVINNPSNNPPLNNRIHQYSSSNLNSLKNPLINQHTNKSLPKQSLNVAEQPSESTTVTPT